MRQRRPQQHLKQLIFLVLVAAVRVTVLLKVFSAMASTKVRRALAWSTVFSQGDQRPHRLGVFQRLFHLPNSFCAADFGLGRDPGGGKGSNVLTARDRQRRSFIVDHQARIALPRDNMNRSLNRAMTSSWASVRYREWISMDRVYSCFKLVMPFSSNTTMPPPSTVSIVLASKLGVIASKSCNIHIPYVLSKNLFGLLVVDISESVQGNE